LRKDEFSTSLLTEIQNPFIRRLLKDELRRNLETIHEDVISLLSNFTREFCVAINNLLEYNCRIPIEYLEYYL